MNSSCSCEIKSSPGERSIGRCGLLPYFLDANHVETTSRDMTLINADTILNLPAFIMMLMKGHTGVVINKRLDFKLQIKETVAK